MALSDDTALDAIGGSSGLDQLLAEIRGLRAEVAALRVELQSSRLPPPSPAATWLQRPNAERLAAEVQRRQALQPDGGDDGEPDTDLDLLIDRLHDLALDNGR